VVVALVAQPASADERVDASTNSFQSDATFLQVGDGERTRTATLGLSWNLPWRTRASSGVLSAYLDASFGRWWIDDQGTEHGPWVTQIGLTPVLRYQWGGEQARWFVELGIGINALIPVIDDDDRRFSTAFNFGDHVAFGRAFGEQGSEEIALRVQHYSNGGIKQPNPGINFLQLRYSHRFR
jgi:hypothetical protein